MSAVYLGCWEAGTPEWHKQRQASIGGSDVAALLGLSPWASRFSLWHERKALIPHEAEKPEMSWGKRLEPVIVQAYAEQMDPACSLQYEPGAVYAHKDRPWQVCSPDALIIPPYGPPVGGLEVKTDRFADGWGKTGTDEIPLYYRCQVQWCMDVFGVDTWDVAFLCSGSDFRTYTIHADAEDQAALRTAARDFLDSLERNERPDIDSHAQTYEAVKQLHPLIDDREHDLHPDLAAEFCRARADLERAKAADQLATSRVADAMGDAKYAKHMGQTIARRQAKGSGTPFLVAGRNLPTFDLKDTA